MNLNFSSCLLKVFSICASNFGTFSESHKREDILFGILIFTLYFKSLHFIMKQYFRYFRFMAKLQKSYSIGLFQRMAIDEVHCCSTWGNDFRPDYKYLGKK